MDTTIATETSAPTRGPVRKNVILAFLSLSTFMIFLDGTVVNTALPAIARDFDATQFSSPVGC